MLDDQVIVVELQGVEFEPTLRVRIGAGNHLPVQLQFDEHTLLWWITMLDAQDAMNISAYLGQTYWKSQQKGNGTRKSDSHNGSRCHRERSPELRQCEA
jgi:hypothetical protein